MCSLMWRPTSFNLFCFPLPILQCLMCWNFGICCNLPLCSFACLLLFAIPPCSPFRSIILAIKMGIHQPFCKSAHGSGTFIHDIHNNLMHEMVTLCANQQICSNHLYFGHPHPLCRHGRPKCVPPLVRVRPACEHAHVLKRHLFIPFCYHIKECGRRSR